jgi:hypothetical protein
MVIDDLFGPRSHDINDERVGPQFQENVSTLLSLLDQVPAELIDFGIFNLTELMRCRAVLTIAIGRWNQGAQVSAEAVNGKDPVERIKRLMQLCHDELPPPEADVKELRTHSKSKTPVVKIAKLTKRSLGSLRQKAIRLGIKLGHRR